METTKPMSDSRIELLVGDIAGQDMSAVVNDTNNDLVYGGSVNDAILRVGGASIQEEADAHSPVRVGDAVVTGGGTLKAQYVIHAASISIGSSARPVDVERATRSVLERAAELNLTTVAFPPLGHTAGNLSVTRSASLMFPIILEYLDSESSLERVAIIVPDEDTRADVSSVLERVLHGEPESTEEE
jgi:O-acetyl-ADP-ribose deacetylase (regulator of RNase III)